MAENNRKDLYLLVSFFDIDERLNGYSVKDTLARIDQGIKSFNTGLSTTLIPKEFYYNFLKRFGFEEKFCFFARGHESSEEKLYALYIEAVLFDLRNELDRCARIFEIEEEDRTKNKHFSCILSMLPFITDIGSICRYFFYRLYLPNWEDLIEFGDALTVSVVYRGKIFRIERY